MITDSGILQFSPASEEIAESVRVMKAVQQAAEMIGSPDAKEIASYRLRKICNRTVESVARATGPLEYGCSIAFLEEDGSGCWFRYGQNVPYQFDNSHLV